MDTKYALIDTTSSSDFDDEDDWYTPRKKRRSIRKHASVNLFQTEPIRRSLRTRAKKQRKNTDERKDVKLQDNENGKSDERSIQADIESGTIIGATELVGELSFVFKWKDDSLTLVPSKEAKIKYPYAVIDFYESCMVWDTFDDEDNLSVSLPN